MIENIHQSHISMWLRCGIQFERRYINGEIIPPGITARRGGATHKAAEINFVQKITSGVDLALSDLTDAARDEYIRLLKDKGVFIPKSQLAEKNQLINDNLNKTIEAVKVFHDEVAPQVQPISAEQYHIARLDDISLPIAGTLDVTTVEAIRDYKIFGASKNQEWADKDLQPSFYCALHENLYGSMPDKYIVDQIVPLKTKTKYEPLTTRRTTKDMDRLKHYIRAFLRTLETGDFLPADPLSWMCNEKYCGYFSSCKFAYK